MPKTLLFLSDHQGVPLGSLSLLQIRRVNGPVFRFLIGRNKNKTKMTAFEREIEEYVNVILYIEEEYSKLPYNTLAFVKAAYALYGSDFYGKTDDDILSQTRSVCDL